MCNFVELHGPAYCPDLASQDIYLCNLLQEKLLMTPFNYNDKLKEIGKKPFFTRGEVLKGKMAEIH